jgi:hypothetical protein
MKVTSEIYTRQDKPNKPVEYFIKHNEVEYVIRFKGLPPKEWVGKTVECEGRIYCNLFSCDKIQQVDRKEGDNA